jgi:hypothetical protein
MNTINLLELIPRCHAGARAKGFWDVLPPKGQQLMLVISELAEALEADRKGQRADLAAFLKRKEDLELTSNRELFPDIFARLFKDCIKDTPEDELADAYIRLCDFAGGFGLSTEDVISARVLEPEVMETVPGNFGTMLLGLTEYVVDIYHADYQPTAVGEALAAIEWVAKQRGIDLATHIDLKLRFNASREKMHGKAY